MAGSIEVTVDGVDETVRYLQDISRGLTEGVSEVLSEMESEIDSTVRSLCPVRTGYLRSTIDISKTSDTTIRCYVGADYASVVDDGYGRRAGRHFFKQPIAEIGAELPSKIDEKISELVSG